MKEGHSKGDGWRFNYRSWKTGDSLNDHSVCVQIWLPPASRCIWICNVLNPQRCHSLVCFFGANSIYVWLATPKRFKKEKTSFWVDPKILVAIRWNIHHGPDFSQARKKQEPSGDLVQLPSPKRFLVQQWFPIIPRGNQTWCETSPFSSTMFQWKPHFEMISPVGTTLMIIDGWFFH